MVQQAQLAPISAEELAKRSRLAIWQSLQRAGYNPQFSYLGRQLLDRSERLTPLAMAALGNDTNAVDKFGSFSDAYANAMLKGGGGGGGYDLSRTGQRNLINSAFQNATPGTDMYGFLTEGDPEEQFNRWRGFEQAAQSGRFAPLVEANLANKQAEFTNFLGKQLSGAADPNTNWIDQVMGRQGPGAYAGGAGTTPPGTTPTGPSAPTTTAYANPAAPTAANPTAYSQSPSGPQGSLTPPINPNGATPPAGPGPQYGTPPAATPNATPGAPGAPTTWKALLDRYRTDQKSWGTRGFRPNPGAFNIGGIGYAPEQDQVTGWNNMSGQGRVTNRGNMAGQFMYYLNLLMNQRNGAGNAALGITNQTTDQELARIAAQRMGKNAIGSTGFSGV